MQTSDLSRYLLLIYIIINIISFFLFAYDKRRAKKEAWRIKESTLLASAFFGPFGAYSAMKIFRHKTQKKKFYLVPTFLLIHLSLIAMIIAGYL
ncbi:DUF1294 domain-containing protein [Methanoplanus limicola]|uniref:DUF1294 domain-containing protein n=1 Tax=Methanoplanus limicola DSM 2279 TaxID=937775 RepID=H1Z110_9EURY|nr:DUF1294 domain-containing protein [Methanoplanus limicola]EHQ34486.1 protein of unknown function DUF1294 [Methanoplanus limicola DSM 2279]